MINKSIKYLKQVQMTIVTISDAFVVAAGILYPAYEMLVHRNEPVVLERWQKYFVVFALTYCSFEILEYTINSWTLPAMKFIGIPLLVYSNRLTTFTYDHQLLPLFVKHEEWLAQYRDLAHQKVNHLFGGTVNWIMSFTHLEMGKKIL